MTGKELRELVNNGITPIIEFIDNVDELELRWNHGMRGYVVGVSTPDNTECVTIKIAEKEFEQYNSENEIADWCKEGTQDFIYKWSDLHDLHKHEEDYIFYEEEDGELCNIKILDNKKLQLFKKYKSEIKDSFITYIEWLENNLLKEE